MIRETTQSDIPAIITLTRQLGFGPDDVEVIQRTLSNYLNGEGNDLWFTAFVDEPLGVVYCTPEVMTNGTWNVLMLIVSPEAHGRGHGRALMNRVEKTLAGKGAHLVIVETSSVDEFAGARAFYPRCGYEAEARIRNFYEHGDDKIIFTKALNGSI